jgi:hypothetical protein
VTCIVDTDKVLARRYLDTSRTLGQSLMTSRTPNDLNERLLKTLELNERDFPWAALYTLRVETSTGQRCDRAWRALPTASSASPRARLTR